MGAVVKLHREVEWYITECATCGVEFAVLNAMDNRWRESHKSFYCPNGHSQSYNGETDKERRLREATARISQLESGLQFQTQRANAAEKKNQKLKRRVGNGVCPCCHRTFKQLAQHMAHKHPDFAPDKP